MNGWRTSTLGQITSFLGRGKSPVYADDNDTTAKPVLNQACVQNGRLDLAKLKFVTRAFWDSLPENRKLQLGDVLINSTGTGTLGRLGFWDESIESAFDSHLTVLRFAKGHVGQFFYYLLSTEAVRRKIEGECTSGSTNQIELLREQLKQVRVTYPIREEAQIAIAKLLAIADRVIEQTESLVAKGRRMRAGLMHDLLSRGIDTQGRLRDPATHAFKSSRFGMIPADWDVLELASCTKETITYGIVQAGPHTPGGVPYIRTGDMSGEALVREHMLCTTPEIAARFKRSEVKAGEIVCAIRATVGRALRVPPELDGANLTQGTARISPAPHMDAEYLLWALRSAPTQNELQLQSKGTTFAEITLAALRRAPVVVPRSIEEQRGIASVLARHDVEVRAQSTHLAKLHRLKTGLMHALLGEGLPVTALQLGSSATLATSTDGGL